MKAKTLKRLQITTAIFLAVLILLFAGVLYLLVGALHVDDDAHITPAYAMADLTPILEKPRGEWQDEDYATLTAQTGIFSRETLSKLSATEIRAFQEALFYEGKLVHEVVAEGLVYHDMLFDKRTGTRFYAPIVPLEPGDVLVTSSSHLFGWRHGHAALVLTNGMLQSAVIGTNSAICSLDSGIGVPWFRAAPNFMVLRLKDADAAARKQIADDAAKYLVGVPYHFTAGIFTPKDQGTEPIDTYCSHLVWQAFKNAGYDIDSDGGLVCTPRDIAESQCFEVIQMYGFDLAKGW